MNRKRMERPVMKTSTTGTLPHCHPPHSTVRGGPQQCWPACTSTMLFWMVCWPTTGNGKPVLFGFQAKERKNPMNREEFRCHRRTHLTWTPAARHTLDVYQFVHVLVEANWCANSMELKAEVDPNIDEAIVSSIYTLNWCLTVAYSSCSARVSSKS